MNVVDKTAIFSSHSVLGKYVFVGKIAIMMSSFAIVLQKWKSCISHATEVYRKRVIQLGELP